MPIAPGSQDFGLLSRLMRMKGGQVCIDGTGVVVEHVAARFAAGETVEELATDYAVSRRAIDAAIRLVLVANGVSLTHKRAQARIEERIPLLVGRD